MNRTTDNHQQGKKRTCRNKTDAAISHYAKQLDAAVPVNDAVEEEAPVAKRRRAINTEEIGFNEVPNFKFLGSDFHVSHLDASNARDLRKLLEIAELRRKRFGEDLEVSKVLIGAKGSCLRECWSSSMCSGCKEQALLLSCCLCPVSLCYARDQANKENSCIALTASEIEKIEQSGEQFLCTICTTRLREQTKFTLSANFHSQAQRRFLALEPLLVIACIWAGYKETGSHRPIRNELEDAYLGCRHLFLYIEFEISLSEIARNEARNAAITDFMKCYPTARVLFCVDGHSRPATGRICMDVTQDGTTELFDCSFKMLFDTLLDADVQAMICSPRKDKKFGKYQSDPLRGMIAVCCGHLMINHESFNEVRSLVRNRTFDFVLGFVDQGITAITVNAPLAVFASDVFLRGSHPYLARESAFCNPTRLPDASVVLVTAEPQNADLVSRQTQTGADYMERWATWKPRYYFEMMKNSHYLTFSSVLVLKVGRSSVYGRKVPRCAQGHIARMRAKGARLYCNDCDANGNYSLPTLGKHFLPSSRSSNYMIWPWPLHLSQWRLEVVWKPRKARNKAVKSEDEEEAAAEEEEEQAWEPLDDEEELDAAVFCTVSMLM